jgi:predicted nicotinamide N-methyase
LRRALTARLTRLGYELERREIRVGGHLVVPFTLVRDPDRVLDDVVKEADRRERASGERESDDELHLPYWAELWDSALGVGEYVGDRRSAIGNRQSILDLGCGMGFAGTVAAMLGHRVTFADIETPALLFARLNSIAYRERVRARRVDWKRDNLGERFEVIIGADVLYDRAQWDYLEPFWRAHLRESHEAFVLLGEPGRQTGEMFEPWIEARGWRLQRSQARISTRELPIRLFQITPAR